VTTAHTAAAWTEQRSASPRARRRISPRSSIESLCMHLPRHGDSIIPHHNHHHTGGGGEPPGAAGREAGADDCARTRM
jgi:hypothetical protein